jgi:hypothetical protein
MWSGSLDLSGELTDGEAGCAKDHPFAERKAFQRFSSVAKLVRSEIRRPKP